MTNGDGNSTLGEPSKISNSWIGLWWAFIRSAITFLLGVAVIVDSLVEKDTATVGKLVVGLVLMGIPSIEDIIKLIRRRG